MSVSGFDGLVQGLHQLDNFCIAAHENPDPDSLGSMVALYLGLISLGKKAMMVCGDPIPYDFPWAALAAVQAPTEVGPCQNMVVLDCHPNRTGTAKPLVEQAQTVFNIDHHVGNRGETTYHYIDTAEPATASMVHRVLRQLDVTITKPMADALYAGIVGDTGGFRYGNTTSSVLALGAELVALGAEPDTTSRLIFETKSWGFMSLLGRTLETMERSADGAVVWMTVDHDAFKESDVDPQEGDQFIQYSRMVSGVKVAILFRETSPGTIRLGFRSHSLDVGSLARTLGGGGHRLASGAKVEGTMDQWVPRVVAAAQALVDSEGGHGIGRNHECH